MKRSFLLGALAFLLFAGVASAQFTNNAGAGEDFLVSHADPDYQLKVGDKIRVTYYEDYSLREQGSVHDAMIMADGTVFFPLIGKVAVEELTIDQLETILKARLAKFIENPIIDVQLMQGTGAYLLGDAVNQGFFPIKPGMRLTEFIAHYSGFGVASEISEVVISRENGETIHVDLESLFEEGNLSQDIVLEPNDKIFIPEKELTLLDKIWRVTQVVSLMLQALTVILVLSQ